MVRVLVRVFGWASEPEGFGDVFFDGGDMMERKMVTRGGCRGGAAADAAGRYVASAVFFWLPDGQRRLLLEGGMEYNSLVVVKGKEEADRGWEKEKEEEAVLLKWRCGGSHT